MSELFQNSGDRPLTRYMKFPVRRSYHSPGLYHLLETLGPFVRAGEDSPILPGPGGLPAQFDDGLAHNAAKQQLGDRGRQLRK